MEPPFTYFSPDLTHCTELNKKYSIELKIIFKRQGCQISTRDEGWTVQSLHRPKEEALLKPELTEIVFCLNGTSAKQSDLG